MSSLTLLRRRTFSTVTTPKPAFVRELADGLVKERNLNRLVQKFKKASEIGRFRRKNGIYEETVRRLASARRFPLIEEILEDQKKYKDIAKKGFSARLIRLYGKSGMFDQAYKMFDEIPNRGLFAFNALLGACLNAKKFDKVDGFFKELPRKLSVEPDLVSYNTVIKAFCEMGSLDSAKLMFDEMEKKGVKPDLITYNTLLDGFFKNRKFIDGEKIWNKMVGNNVDPNIKSYNAKLLGLVTEGKLEEAVKLIEEMKIKGIKPDLITFNHMISGYVNNNGKLEEAKEWYRQIRKNGCAPDKLIFTALVPFVCEKGDLGFAMELCKEIFGRKILVGQKLLQRVVNELVKASKTEDAEKVVELGKTKHFRQYKLSMPTK